MFNLALLLKWRWRMHNATDELRYIILNFKYGNIKDWVNAEQESFDTKRCSLRWHDMIKASSFEALKELAFEKYSLD